MPDDDRVPDPDKYGCPNCNGDGCNECRVAGSGLVFNLFVPVLAPRLLSPNGSRGEAHQAVSAAKVALRADTYHAALSAAPQAALPRFQRAVVSFCYRHSFKRPGDGLYRPDDPSNLGGDVLKGPMDALVDLEVLIDDDYEHVALVTLQIERVAELADEGIAIMVREAD